MATTEMATLSGGNTKHPKKRDYILTVNEKSIENYDKIMNYITGLKSNNYYLCCEHIGQENKHYHIYCQFKTPIRLSIKKLFGCHIEQTYGSPQQCIKYLRCEDDKHKSLGIVSKQINEVGEVRLSGGRTIKEIKEMTREEREQLPIYMYNIVKKIDVEEGCEIDVKEWFKEVCVVYIQGPSGSGKSLKAKKIIMKNKDLIGTKFNEVSYHNGFWIGVGNALAAIYDDFRDSQIPASEFIKFIDLYGKQVKCRIVHPFCKKKKATS